MVRIVFFLLWSMGLSGQLLAQFGVTVQQPALGLIRSDQLWNMALSNNTGGPQTVSVQLELQDVTAARAVLHAVTSVFQVPKGVRVLSVKDVQPVQYTYDLAGNAPEFLPVGRYLACYTVQVQSERGMVPVAQECISLNVEPLAPPLLMSPPRDAVLRNKQPLLSWMPPAPVQLFSGLTYEVAVVEVLPGQHVAEAVRQNIPLFHQGGIAGNVLPYPTGNGMSLDTGKQYAWQVMARDWNGYAMASEAWGFSIASDTVPAVSLVESDYILLSSEAVNQGVALVAGRQLNIRFYAFHATSSASFQLEDNNGKVLQEFRYPLNYGDNFIRIPLPKTISPQITYRITVTDSRKHTAAARFRLQ